MSFKDISYQPKVVFALTEMFRQGRLPHAFLFAGPAGAGQREMSLEFAKTLFCQKKDGAEPCGTCVDCHQVAKNSHPDLVILSPQEDSLVIKIEEIRAMINQSGFKPFQASAKVFILDPAEAMNETAQNALLKTLEEPEPGTYFILICHALEKLLPTVKSRAQILNFVPAKQYEPLDADAEKAKGLAMDWVLEQLQGQRGHLSWDDFAVQDRAVVSVIFDFMIEWFREVLLISAGAASLLEVIPDRERKEALSRAFSGEELAEIIELLAEFRGKILGFMNIKLIWSVLKDRLTQYRTESITS